MNKKYKNIFFVFGVVVLAFMVSQLNFAEVWRGLQHAGYWFLAVVFLWIFLYFLNTAAWWIIIKSNKEKTDKRISFAHLYRLTVTGFALNYATPGGLMGGEPYRIMSLSPYIGTVRATSSVILYAMTHIFSHFWFWLLSIFLFFITQKVTFLIALMLVAIGFFCLLGIWFFLSGYKKGLAYRTMNVVRHIPFVGKKVNKFMEKHKEKLDDVDKQIAALHHQSPIVFISALLLELTCRIVSSLEIYFVLLVIMPDPSFITCILILAFTSFFANLLFFIPLQMGGREGGFVLSATGLALTAGTGIFVALIVRIRELIWVAIGLLLIKLDK
nr:flippase-like domain-containing protein [Prevotella sp.]